MKISSEINSIAHFVGEEKALEYMGKAGFDGWDFSLFEMCNYDWSTRRVLESSHPLASGQALAFARRLKQVGLDQGMVCNQSHAPFPTSCPQIRAQLQLAIECTAEAGGHICVIHPDNDASAEENAEMFQQLLPFAKDCGVKIATENMWNWDGGADRSCFAACATEADFLKHLEAVNDEFFVACLDIGHAEMVGSGDGAANMIRALGSHLQALHIHDNDLLHDLHQLPFAGSIDFAQVVGALRDIRYSGWLTLEADHHLNAHTPVETGVQELANSARRLAAMFEA